MIEQEMQHDRRERSVLLVEDEQVLAMHLEDELTSAGYRVVPSVVTAEEALASVRGCQPSIVLMDIRLAGALDGVTAAEEIYVCERTPVVILTACREHKILQRVARSGAYGLLIKPFNLDELLTVLELALFKHAEVMRGPRPPETATMLLSHDGVVCCASAKAEQLLGADAQVGTEPPWAASLVETGSAATHARIELRQSTRGDLLLSAERLRAERGAGWLVRVEAASNEAS